MHRSAPLTTALLLLGIGAGAAACNGSSSPPGGTGDAGADSSSADAGATDGARPTDSSAPRDSSSSQDASSPTDAEGADTSVPSGDASADATAPQDGGADTGTDAGFVVETDAGTFTASSWMGAFPGSTSLTDLSIPGTHDTGATIDMPGTTGTTKCQDLSVADQLAAGVRYFDIRVQNLSNELEVYHLTVDQQLSFASVLQSVSAFLTANPSETLIMCVKEETPDPQTGSTNTFEQTFDSYTAQNSGLWYLGDSIPTLDQARGKIVLLRRFGIAESTALGIDASSGWADNTTFSLSTGSATLQIQDYYQITSNASKWTAITGLFSEAVAPDASASALFLNNTSAYFQLDSGLEDILSVSDAINPQLTSYFASASPGRYGIVGMDFVDTAKASLVLKTNFR